MAQRTKIAARHAVKLLDRGASREVTPPELSRAERRYPTFATTRYVAAEVQSNVFLKWKANHSNSRHFMRLSELFEHQRMHPLERQGDSAKFVVPSSNARKSLSMLGRQHHWRRETRRDSTNSRTVKDSCQSLLKPMSHRVNCCSVTSMRIPLRQTRSWTTKT